MALLSSALTRLNSATEAAIGPKEERSEMRNSGLEQLHLERAIKLGFDLFSYSQACVCEGLKTPFQDQVAVAASEFALHARRICELNDLVGQSAPMVSFGFLKGGDLDRIKIERDFNFSINLLIHAQDMVVKYTVHPERRVFGNEDNFVLSHLDVRTDRRDFSHVSLFAISGHFLTRIAPAVIASRSVRIPKHPDRQEPKS